MADLLEGGDVLRCRVEDRDELALDLRERIDELTEVDDLVLVEPLTGVRRVDEEERVLAVVGLDRLAIRIRQERKQERALARLRFFALLLSLLVLAAYLSLVVWRQIEQLFGL